MIKNDNIMRYMLKCFNNVFKKAHFITDGFYQIYCNYVTKTEQ